MALPDTEGYASLLPDYTELRIQENRSLAVAVVNGDVMGNTKHTKGGVSARSYRGGHWGFASTPMTDHQSVAGAITTAVTNAEFLEAREKTESGTLPGRPARIEKDLSTSKPGLSQKEIIDFVRQVDGMIGTRFDRVVSRTASLQLLEVEKKLLTSDGSYCSTVIPRSILYLAMTADSGEGPVQIIDPLGGLGGFEDVFSTPDALEEHLAQMHGHLMKKAEGVHPEPGTHDCVLEADLAGILAHEAIGHTVEADMVRGGSVAGDHVGELVASPMITLVDFASEFMGESCPVPVYMDDEGVLARDAVIIENGVLRRFLHNRESAAHFGAEPLGNARAYGFDDEPIIRMRNTAILPGTQSLDEMLASIENGYYLMKYSNGQADSTGEFMFGVAQGYEIRNGRLGRAIRDTTISGVAFSMLGTVSMVSSGMKWTSAGMCGKKQPIPVGMGGPALKCRINIGGR